MSEKFNFTEHTHDWVGHAFLIASAHRHLDDEFYEDYQKRCQNDNPGVDIELTFNGFPMKFTAIVERLKQCFEEAVEERAVELLKERAGDLYVCLDDFKEKLNDYVVEQAKAMFPKVRMRED